MRFTTAVVVVWTRLPLDGIVADNKGAKGKCGFQKSRVTTADALLARQMQLGGNAMRLLGGRVFFSVVLVVALAAAACGDDGGGTSASGSDSRDLILATGAPTNLSIGKGQQFFAEKVEEMSGGAVTMQVHLDGALYSERTSLEALKSGAIQIGGASNANMGAFTEAFFWMDLPFLIESEDALMDIMNSELGDQMIEEAESDGFKILARLQNGGYRSVVTTRAEVRRPEDLSGLKMRTTASPVEVAMLESWGANPVAVDWAETYDALSQGVADGEFVMWSWLDKANHCDVLKWGVNGRFVIGLQFLVMDINYFDSLDDETRQTLLDAGKEAEDYVAELDETEIPESFENCESKGVEMYELTDADLQAWEANAQEVWSQFENEVPPELIEDIQSIQS